MDLTNLTLLGVVVTAIFAIPFIAVTVYCAIMFCREVCSTRRKKGGDR